VNTAAMTAFGKHTVPLVSARIDPRSGVHHLGYFADATVMAHLFGWLDRESAPPSIEIQDEEIQEDLAPSLDLDLDMVAAPSVLAVPEPVGGAPAPRGPMAGSPWRRGGPPPAPSPATGRPPSPP